MFFKSDKGGLNGLDQAIQRAAVDVSRRKFLVGVTKWGAGLGLGLAAGLANTRSASASSCHAADTCVRRGTCYDGSVKFQTRYLCDDGSTVWADTTCGWC